MSLTAEELRRLLDYDAETGVFTWLISPRNSIPTGSKAGNHGANGYVRISVDGRLYLAHRLAWLHVHGEWPPHEIDHVNGDKSDNRIANLRRATRSQNCANKRSRRDNVSGVKGVQWFERNQKWGARICIDGQTQFLGLFDRLEDAAAAYKNAAHKYFGEFARTA